MCLLAAALAGCSDNVPTTTATTTTTTAVPTVPAVLSLGTDKSAIVTDNATAATLTATMVDSSNAVMAGVVVNFSTTSGNLSASSATTDANGQATVLLKSGISDASNRTATVTASQGAQSASIPILIKGSTVALTVSPATNIQEGAGTLTATALATDGAGLGKFNQTIRFSIGAASTGSGTLSAATLVTDSQGVTPTLTFTPTAAGTVVLTAEWLDAAGAVTATATQNITVEAALGVAFAITTPAANPTALTSGAAQALAVTVPTTIGGVTVSSVRISASSGTWTGTNPATGPLSSIMQSPAANAVAASYVAPANSGSATVQVDALDASGVTLGTLTRTFAVSAPSSAAAKLFLASSASTIVPSSGSNISTSTLKVTVRDANNNAVGGAAVMFGLLGTTGSGESVSPAVAITDSAGEATTTFSAGSAPTLAAIYAQASIVGQTCRFLPNGPVASMTGSIASTTLTVTAITSGSLAVGQTITCATCLPDTVITSFGTGTGGTGTYNINNSQNIAGPTGFTASSAETNTLCDAAPLMVSSSAVSVTVGFGTKIEETANFTQYKLPGSVLVVNSNGSAAAGATVTLTVFPIAYTNGTIYLGQGLAPTGFTLVPQCLGPETFANSGIFSAFFAAEDVNRNGIMDPAEDVNGNGLLSPPQAAGGAVPLTVTTDANGAATFYLQYPKSSAWFIIDEVTARVIVMGTESSAKTTVDTLPMLYADKYSANCELARTSSY